ncbi:MAG: Sulfonate transporter substrate-binding protein [Microbacteriaceae bacterium]|nr:Sulfonate transporter substrate-binding protein [Microbacteriaceae bacterium]
MSSIRRTLISAAALGLSLLLASCASTAASPTVAKAQIEMPSEVRFGYFPNFTHAVAIVALDKGYLKKRLGSKVTLTPVTFNAGPAAIEALFGGAVDVTLAGPNPTITGFTQSKGAALRVISGAASGGAGLVVRAGIGSPADLKGKTIATPQLGNTQDVALRYWLKKHNLSTTTEGGGDVHIVPQDNATALAAFVAGKLDGAWVPEPWVTRLVAEGNGTELVDEATLWPKGKFVVTNTIAATTFVDKYPAAISAIVAAELDAIDFIKANPDQAKSLVNAHIKTITGSQIDPAYLDKAWSNVDFTIDPLPSTLLASANHARAVGLLDSVDLAGIYDLSALNALLTKRGDSKITVP